MERCRTWSLTFNNDLESWEKTLTSLREGVTWLVFQRERGTHEHIQAGIHFDSVKSFKQIQLKFFGAHVERARDPKALWEYCQKEDTRVSNPYIYGEGPVQGKRRDLEQVAEMIKGGADLTEVAMVYPEAYIKYNKGFEKLWNRLNMKKRTEKPVVKWFWGKAGTGKTRRAVEESNGRYYIKDSSPWWDNYEGQNIIIDDFDVGKWPYRDFLRLLDRYEYQGQVKGGYVYINSNIYITCEYEPKDLWSDNELEQVIRRIDVIEEIHAQPPAASVQ